MTAPIPTTEAVEAATRAFHSAMSGVPAWDKLPEISRHNMRQAVLPLLAAAYPQIVADVLDWSANYLLSDAARRYGDAAEALQYQAREIEP